MKIVCESCGAKYSIADEKVAGKVFKIRCKKCSAVIVVKGENPEGEESTRVYDYGAEAVWHVVVAGEQQGPLAPRQIGELLSENKIDWEAYVWREGMDGWQPAREVETLVSAVMADSQGAGSPKSAAAYGTGQVFGGSSDMGADPFASDDGGLSGVMAQQAASAGGGGGGGADLFAKSARSPFSGSSDDEERAPAASGSSPRVHQGEALTGQRNENSVLFSLSNLQALATGSGSTPTATSARPGMAVGEGSGLIDIRALASATQSVSDKPNGSSRDKVEDLLSVGAGGAGFSAASFAVAPVSEKADTGKLILVGMAAAILLLGGAVTYLVLRQPPQQVIAATTPTPTDTAAAPAAGQAVAAPTPQAAAPEATGEREPSEAEGAASGRPEHDRESARRAEGSAPRKTGGRDAPKAADKPEPAAAPAPEPAPAPRKGGDQSIDDLLSGALGKPNKPAAAAKPAGENLPPTPSRDDVLTALKSVAPRVSACGGGQSGLATAKISVAGSTGRVTSVDVSGQFAGTPVATCVAKEVGKAKFPRFATPTFAVTFPFKI
jgi:predicted Zn finger-like uncharacterized protein